MKRRIKVRCIIQDIDGVLNSLYYDQNRKKYQGNIDETRLVLLKELVEQTGAKIVLCSSWRKHWNKDREFCDAVGEELNATFEKYGLEIYDKTPEIDAADRPLEIRTWLQTHSGEVEGYVIFDDHPWGWGELESHLVKTNYRIGRGLEPTHIEKAKNIILGGNNDDRV